MRGMPQGSTKEQLVGQLASGALWPVCRAHNKELHILLPWQQALCWILGKVNSPGGVTVGVGAI